MVNSIFTYLDESDSVFHPLTHLERCKENLNLGFPSSFLLGSPVPGFQEAGVWVDSRWLSVYSHAGEFQSWLAITGLWGQHLGFWIPI